MHTTPSPINTPKYNTKIEITIHFPHVLMKTRRMIESSSAVNKEISDIFHDDFISLTN
jgi:hypothetical protein